MTMFHEVLSLQLVVLDVASIAISIMTGCRVILYIWSYRKRR